MQPLIELRIVASEATKVLSETHNAPDLIPFGTRLIDLVNRNPDLRSAFGEAFVSAFDQRQVFDLWLLQFCMHALRWPELQERFNQLSRQAIAEQDWNRIQPLQHVLDAFEQDWEDAQDFYAEYFHAKGTRA
jgi:hypothetical protein